MTAEAGDQFNGLFLEIMRIMDEDHSSKSFIKLMNRGPILLRTMTNRFIWIVLNTAAMASSICTFSVRVNLGAKTIHGCSTNFAFLEKKFTICKHFWGVSLFMVKWQTLLSRYHIWAARFYTQVVFLSVLENICPKKYPVPPYSTGLLDFMPELSNNKLKNF